MPTTYYGNPFTPYPTGPGNNPQLDTDIQSLLTPGLVPDIARQSAEVTAGRGIAGSPAAGTTAVKMSEQNFQQRLALASQLMSGQQQRALPYQITPYQSLMAEIAKLNAYRYPPTGGGGGGGGPAATPGKSSAQKFMESPWGPPNDAIPPYSPAPGAAPATSWYPGWKPTGALYESGAGSGAGNLGGGLWGGVNVGGPLGGPGSDQNSLTLDDMYEQYGFNTPLASDSGGDGGDLTNWDWNYQPPDAGVGGGGDYFGD